METIVKKEKMTSHNSKDLTLRLGETLVEIIAHLKTKTYQEATPGSVVIEKPVYQLSPDTFKISDHVDDIMGKMGISDRRRLRNYLNNLIGKKNLFNISKLFRFLTRTGIFETKVDISMPKHEAIQEKRKKMLLLRSEYEHAMQAYKQEKGDFYKNAKRV